MNNSFPVTYSILSVEALATEVLSHYDIAPPLTCQLLHRGLNDTFLVNTPEAKYILRAYRAGWRSLSEILYELEILLHLKHAGLPVAAPIARKDGNLTGTVMAPEGLRYLVLFTHAPGKGLAYEAEAENEAYLYGKTAAKLHAASDAFQSSHQRFVLNLEHLLDQPLQAIEPLMAHRPEDWDYLMQLAEKLRLRVQAIPLDRLETGFCHGDFHGGNAHLDQDQTLTFFDFDCCGLGWRAYDLAVFRWGARLSEKDKERWPAFLRGYTEARPLSETDIQATSYFVAIRHIWLLGLHTGNGQDWGFGWMNDRYFDHFLKFFREWEAEFLSEKPAADTEQPGAG
jgi:Ser/Thr protein kinase RdoA (MazF antagonist)